MAGVKNYSHGIILRYLHILIMNCHLGHPPTAIIEQGSPHSGHGKRAFLHPKPSFQSD